MKPEYTYTDSDGRVVRVYPPVGKRQPRTTSPMQVLAKTTAGLSEERREWLRREVEVRVIWARWAGEKVNETALGVVLGSVKV